MDKASSKLRDLHYLLKNALGNIPIKQRTDRVGLSLPIKDYSFIERDDAPLGLTPADYFEYLPKYAELTGLVTKHKDYDKMQNILQWFVDNEDKLESIDTNNEDPYYKTAESEILDSGFNEWMDKTYGTDLSDTANKIIISRNPTGIENPANYMSKVTFEKDTDGDGDIDTKVTKITDNKNSY